MDLLAADPDRLLLLACDDVAAKIPWEYATLIGRQFLACRYGFLRLVEGAALPSAVTPSSISGRGGLRCLARKA